jgi:hypothetical protein
VVLRPGATFLVAKAMIICKRKELYDDMKTHYCALFEIIFRAEGGANLQKACEVIAIFIFVKLDSKEETRDDVEMNRRSRSMIRKPVKKRD